MRLEIFFKMLKFYFVLSLNFELKLKFSKQKGYFLHQKEAIKKIMIAAL